MTGSTVLGWMVVPKLGKRELWLFSITKGGCETRTHFSGRGVMNKAGRLKARVCSSEKKGEKILLSRVGCTWAQLMSGHLVDQSISIVPGVFR